MYSVYRDGAFNSKPHRCLLTGRKAARSSVISPLCPLAVWFGVIFIRHGLYQDGVFKFTVYIPDNYPDGECPVSTLLFCTHLRFTPQPWRLCLEAKAESLCHFGLTDTVKACVGLFVSCRLCGCCLFSSRGRWCSKQTEFRITAF